MGFESGATYINDLQPTNPTSTDGVSQGDDHLRLIKQVLQNTFGNASRQFQIPTMRAVSATTTLLKSDGGGMVAVATTGGAVTLTMPTLVALDAGWSVNILKTTVDVNPIFVKAASGNINSIGYGSLAQARRCIPGTSFLVLWDGTNWNCERVNSLPIGSMVAFYGTVLPAGFEWPNGQTLASVATNYPEYNAAVGSGLTPDLRGRSEITLDNLGGTAAGRLPNGATTGLSATTLGSAAGTDATAITVAQLPGHTHGVGTLAATDSGHTHPFNAVLSTPSSAQTGGGGLTAAAATGSTTGTGTANISMSGATASVGSGGLRSNLTPSIMCGKILVVE